MFTGILRKITSTHQNLRTDEIEGRFQDFPVVGECFLLLGESLTLGMNVRMVRTTPIKEVQTIGNGFAFWTQNSHYELVNISNSIKEQE